MGNTLLDGCKSARKQTKTSIMIFSKCIFVLTQVLARAAVERGEGLIEEAVFLDQNSVRNTMDGTDHQ